MKEFSHHILDIANNSIRGKATSIQLSITENQATNQFIFQLKDNGCGIPKAILDEIKNPFTTTRKTRKVGLGIPMLDATCRQCDGRLTIETEVGKGTIIRGTMALNHIDRPPMGNIASTLRTLLTSHENVNIEAIYKVDQHSFIVSTLELKEILGEVSLSTPEVVQWLYTYIEENITALYNSE